jgi:hypothetical protein
MSIKSRKKKCFCLKKRGLLVRLTYLLPSVSRLSKQCGILNISQPYRPSRSLTGIALLYFTFLYFDLVPRRLVHVNNFMKMRWCFQNTDCDIYSLNIFGGRVSLRMPPVGSIFLRFSCEWDSPAKERLHIMHDWPHYTEKREMCYVSI